MIEILKKIHHLKSGINNQLLGYSAVFIILLWEFLGALYMTIFLKMPPVYISVFAQMIVYVFGGVLLYYTLIKLQPVGTMPTEKNSITQTQEKAQEQEQDSDLEVIIKSSKNSLIPFILNMLVGLGFITLLKNTLSILVELRFNLMFIVVGVLFVISLFGISIVLLSAVLIANNSAKKSQVHLYLMKSMGLYFKNLKFVIISLVTMLLTSTVIVGLGELLWSTLFSMNFSPLLIIFYKTTIVTCIVSMSLLFVTKAIYIIYSGQMDYEPDQHSPIGYIIAVLFLVGIIYSTMPKFTNIVKEEYSNIIMKAEEYRADGNLYLCGNSYKKAYALVKAYNGYLIDMEVQKDKKATQEKIDRVIGEANALFRQAYDFYPNASIIYYLDGLRNLERNKNSTISALKTAKSYDPNFYPVDLLLLSLGRETAQDELMKESVKSLILNEVYLDSGNLNKLSGRKIEDALEKLENYNKVTLENITTIAYDYYSNQLYKEAMAELQMIKSILPNDVVTNYLIAMTDLELKSDNKAYTTAIEAAETILNQYPNEKWAQELYTGVTLRAGNQNVMDVALQEAYERNSDNLDVAEQYAYSILKKNYSSSYYEVTEQAEEVVDKILASDGERWFALYCKSLIELYKGEYEASIGHLNHFSEIIIEDDSLFSIYDELYNIYVMKYARRMVMDVTATEVLNTSDLVDGFAYNYILGAFGSMSNTVEFAETIDYLNQAITYNPTFSKPYFMIGNAQMEYGVQNSESLHFAEAEKYYAKSIQIFENDPFAWFAMGHVYRKQERFEEALGAFQRTLTLMPAEDHQSDHFGVSIHSVYQITELQNILAKKEGE